MQSKDPTENGLFPSDDVRRARAEQTLWQVLGTLFHWRRLIVGVTVVMAIVSVVLSLMMANWYQATARVLTPESGSSLSSALLRNLPSAASALLGGGGGDYTRYLAILTSRSMMEAAVDSFDLVEVYELEGHRTPRQEAIRTLQDNVEFELDAEYDFLSLSVLDKDPQRASDIANFFVRRLNEDNARLASQNARSYRIFIQKRYEEALAAMDSVMTASEAFQRRHGIFDLTSQTESFFTQLAELRAQALEAEVQHEVALAQYGPDNATVETYRKVAEATNRKYRDALAGQEQVLPVAKAEVPGVVHEYARLEMERTIQATVIEVIGPLYEQARFQEEREAEAVQVVDPAVPPTRKAKPKRSVIVVAATLSAFLLAAFFVLVLEWWRRRHAYFAHRLEQAAAEAGNTTRKAKSPVS